MNKRNIYKMDDILLFLSLAMLALVVFLSLDWLKLIKEVGDFTAFLLMAPEVLGPKFYTVIMYTLAAITAQIIGRYIRYLEKKSLLILDELEKSSKIRLSELRMKLGMSEAKVKKLVVKLSGVSSLGIELEGDKVVQKRSSTYAGSSAGVSAANADGSKKKGPSFLLLIFLFFTPLWPVAVFLIFRSSMKNMQRKNEEV